jgi:parvulin-like peptidyl-prolyl isomerase
MCFFALVLAFFSISEKEPVAIIGGKTIFKEDIPENLSLDQYLQNIVFLELAREKGYDDSVRARVDGVFEQQIISKTLRKFSKESSEPTLYDRVLFYENSKKKLKVRLIQTKTFLEALQAYVEVLKGEDFGSVSEKYSFSPTLRKSKGLLERSLSWSFSFPRSFRLLFKMDKGYISIPLKYGMTWNVIKIIEVEEQSRGDIVDRNKMLEEISQPRFVSMVAHDKNALFMYKFKNFIPWIANPRINSEGLSLFGKRMGETEESSRRGGNPFREEDMDVVLGEGTIGEYTIRDFLKDAAQIGDMSVFNSEAAAVKFIEDNIYKGTLVAMCKRLGVHREPSFAEAYKRSIESATLDFFKRKEILPVIKGNEDALKAFYEENKEKYKIEERREISLIEVKEERETQGIRKRLLRGENFGVLARELSIGEGKRKGGDIGYIRKDQRGAIGREAFLLKKGEISKAFKVDRGWAIIKVTDIKESYVPGYSDVKSSVRIDYRENQAKEIGNKIFDQNKEKFGLKILG